MRNNIYLLAFFSAIFLFSGCGENPAGGGSPVSSSFVFSENLWKSIDGGESWQVKNKGEGKANTTSGDILSLAINPKNGNQIYAGLRKGGILRTLNGGETWSFANFQSEKVYGLAVAGPEGSILYASGVWQGTGKFFRSDDQGATWKELYSAPQKGPLVISLAVDRKNERVLYLTTSDKEVLKTSDGGETWKNIYIADSPVLKVTIDSIDSSLVYFISQSGAVLRSLDGGEKIENIQDKVSRENFSMGGGQFSLIRTDPKIGGKVYLAGQGGILVSRDRGENWSKIPTLNNPNNFPIRVLAVNPQNTEEIIYGAAGALVKSLDGGKSWKTYQFRESKLRVNVLEYDPLLSSLYLGFSK